MARTSSATWAALPTSVWIRMYACTMWSSLGRGRWGAMLVRRRGRQQRAGAPGLRHHQRMFLDRGDAGRRLSAALAGTAPADPPVVLGIPRGGVIVAAEVAAALVAPLDVVVTRKIGAPGNPELAVGAIAPGVQVWDGSLLGRLGVGPGYLRAAVEAEEAEMARRTAVYRGARPAPPVADRTVLIVDDGLATGATALAAVRWARAANA